MYKAILKRERCVEEGLLCDIAGSGSDQLT